MEGAGGILCPIHSDLFMLDLFARSKISATFFVLGWVAEAHPRLVPRLLADGHEVATHGFWHRRIPDMTRDELRVTPEYRAGEPIVVVGSQHPSQTSGPPPPAAKPPSTK